MTSCFQMEIRVKIDLVKTKIDLLSNLTKTMHVHFYPDGIPLEIIISLRRNEDDI